MLAILAAVMLAATPQFDTVFTADGGRLVGTVVEESPQGITVQLPDGTTRRFHRKDVTRIEYRDGSVSTPNRPAPPPAYQPAPAPAPAGPPAYQPPPPPAYPPPQAYPPPPPYGPPPYRPAPARSGPYDPQGGMPPILPIYGVFGIGGLFTQGDAGRNVPIGGGPGVNVSMDQAFDPQLDVYLEGGLRLNQHLALGLYVDVGVGDPSSNVRAEPACATFGNSCTATTGHVGVLLRHTFRPRDYSTPWLAIGTGYEWGEATLHDGGGGSTQYFRYTGWEIARLMAGVDLRTNPIFGVGLYGGVSLGRYSRYTDASVDANLGGGALHTMVEGGLRFTLFP
jgi:hypothetical protein